MDPAIFPPLNATLNGLAGCFLILALVQIKRGNRKGHARSMVTALVISAVFLVCYLTHKVLLGHATTRFPAEYPVARPIYLAILFTHIPLAIRMLPLIFIALRRALKGDFEGHRRMVKVAYPIWLYVSITGVIVYFMLYQWFPPTQATEAKSEPASAEVPRPESAGGPSGGILSFESEELSGKAAEGQKEFTATFVAKNPGSAPVTLTHLDSSCSCLKVEASETVIPPGGSATITAVFDISKLSGESEKSVYVMTDIPGFREKKLTVKVSVPPVLTIEPTMITWTKGGQAEPREAVIRIMREKSIHVLEAKSSRDAVTAKLETVEDGREYRVVLTPNSTDAILLGLVRMKTDCELEEHQNQLLYFAVQDEATAKKG
ncbi:MAG: DUF420 domain-containing protein [Verrucomicrobiae bacterium]|nr:DUF420 domain-containing protein [Verrucomicrobiae bacterium]